MVLKDYKILRDAMGRKELRKGKADRKRTPVGTKTRK